MHRNNVRLPVEVLHLLGESVWGHTEQVWISTDAGDAMVGEDESSTTMKSHSASEPSQSPARQGLSTLRSGQPCFSTAPPTAYDHLSTAYPSASITGRNSSSMAIRVSSVSSSFQLSTCPRRRNQPALPGSWGYASAPCCCSADRISSKLPRSTAASIASRETEIPQKVATCSSTVWRSACTSSYRRATSARTGPYT